MMFSKVVLAAGVLAAGGGYGAASAQTCPTVPTPTSGSPSLGTYLSGLQIRQLVTSKWACVGTFPHAEWNEQHVSGGVLNDYKLGASSTTDPTSKVGTWTVQNVTFAGNVAGAGTVTYSYTGGPSFIYYISASSPVTGAPPAGIYSFCGTATGGTSGALNGKNWSVNVNAGTGNGGC